MQAKLSQQERQRRREQRHELQAARTRAIRSGQVVELYAKCELTGLHYRPE